MGLKMGPYAVICLVGCVGLIVYFLMAKSSARSYKLQCKLNLSLFSRADFE